MKEDRKKINLLRKKRMARSSAKVFGTATKPRLAVHKTLKHFSVQAIDDVKGLTLATATDLEDKNTKTRKDKAVAVGKLIAKKLLDNKIQEVVFDKRHNKYHGLIKDLADAAREAGLKF